MQYRLIWTNFYNKIIAMFKLSLSLALVAIATAKKYGSTFNGESYISQTRQQKSDMIWSEVTANTKSSGWHLAGALIVD